MLLAVVWSGDVAVWRVACAGSRGGWGGEQLTERDQPVVKRRFHHIHIPRRLVEEHGVADDARAPTVVHSQRMRLGAGARLLGRIDRAPH